MTPGPPPASNPSSARRNRRTKDFRFLFEELPPEIQALARKAFKQFLANPNHTALRLHRLKDTGKGQHRRGSFSVSINMQYRAVYVEDGDTNVWYWVGTHAQYNRLTGKN